MVDSVAGAVVSAVSVLLVAWMIASPLASSPFPVVAGQVRKSALVQAVDAAMPDGIRSVYDTLRKAIDRRGLPDVLDPLTPTQVRNVPPPDKSAVSARVAASVQGSVVKITGIAPSCSRQIDGSGFVYARERVMTNAHVLAGVGHPKVYAEDRVYAAHPVYIDEETDVAILDVPGLPEVPLAFAPKAAATGSDTIIMGYPGGGSLYIGAARVRDRGEISGPDFRDRRTVVRDVYALYGTVRAGNSGGPLLSTDGKVLGVVFASSVDDPTTGYALTAQLVKKAATVGSTATAPVGTGPCE
jgi:S1-C subfamily serine protease